MKERLSWTEIKELYPGEWVQLTDCDWDDFETQPRAGVVRLHSKSKRQFNRLIIKRPRAKDSALVLVPGPKLDDSLCLFPGVIEIRYERNKNRTNNRAASR